MIKIAINGMGRVGRLVLRRLIQAPWAEVVCVNDLMDTRTLAHLVKLDSVHGRAPFPVSHTPGSLLLGDRPIPHVQMPDPMDLPFGQQGATVVLECTGRLATRALAASHLRGSVTRALVSAPCPDADATWLPGHPLPEGGGVFSASDGTTHALALMVDILDHAFGLEHGLVTVVHSYQGDQKILDLPHTHPRLARAASVNMIPCPTDVVAELARVRPHLGDRLQAMAVHVPTPDVSLVDLTVTLARKATPEAINAAFRAAAEGHAVGLLTVAEDEQVSVDFVGEPASCIFDPFLTKACGNNLFKLVGWFDNEWAYACRLVDLAGGLR